MKKTTKTKTQTMQAKQMKKNKKKKQKNKYQLFVKATAVRLTDSASTRRTFDVRVDVFHVRRAKVVQQRRLAAPVGTEKEGTEGC